jgi:peroxiredoxin
VSKHDRIRQERAAERAAEGQGWTAGAAKHRAGTAWGGALVILVAVAVILVVASRQSTGSDQAGKRISSGPAPAFAEQDVSTGAPITSSDLRGKNVLLFFSEGVMCQACFEQIQSLEKRSADFHNRDLTLINITTDSSDILREAVNGYGIKTPMISDESRAMSNAYGAIGQGMHPDTDGHTFVLVDRTGRIRWRHDYTNMFIEPDQLFAEMPVIH